MNFSKKLLIKHMSRQIKIAVIGAGYWGEKLIEEYLKLSTKNNNIKLSVIVDKNYERLNYIKNKFNLPDKMFYSDFYDFINNSNEIDAAHIATPNETHYQIALELLERGKHLLIEKPMTTSSRTALKLAREAEKRGIVLLVGHIFRFNNAINMAKKLIESKMLGKIYYISLKWTTYMQNLPERDIIFDLAPHPIDIINHLLEEWPFRVYAVAKSFKRKLKGLEESAFIIMELPDDTLAEVTLSWLQQGVKTRMVEIIGENSTLYIDALNQKIHQYDNYNRKIEIQIEANNTIEAMINHFIDRIINERTPINSPLIGAITVHILEKIRESLNNNTSVPIMLP
jgi:predicted dehydrogenase